MNTLAKLWTFIITSFVGIIIYLRYSILSAKNEQLEEDINDSKKIIDIQGKVLDVTQNTKHTNFDGTIERLRKNKL